MGLQPMLLKGDELYEVLLEKTGGLVVICKTESIIIIPIYIGYSKDYDVSSFLHDFNDHYTQQAAINWGHFITKAQNIAAKKFKGQLGLVTKCCENSVEVNVFHPDQKKRVFDGRGGLSFPYDKIREQKRFFLFNKTRAI